MEKILVFSNHPAYTYNLRKEVIDGFIQKGYNVTLAVPYGKEIDYFEGIGVEIMDIQFKGRSINPLDDFILLKDCHSIIKTVKPDIVLTYTTKLNIYGGLAARMTNTPYIPMITGLGGAIEQDGILQTITSSLYRMGIKKAKTIFIQNDSILNKMNQHNMIHVPFEMTPGSGVSLDRHQYSEYPEENNEIRFVFIGRIMREKGIYELIEAAKYITKKYPSVIFDVIGYAGLKEDLAFVSEADKAGLINYLGEQDDVRPYIHRGHATILPSYFEGMANVLLESAAAGRPILTTYVPGCRETFDEGISGFGFEVRDVKSLEEAIENFILLPHEEKRKMGKAGRIKMENLFDRKIILNMYVDEIESLNKN